MCRTALTNVISFLLILTCAAAILGVYQLQKVGIESIANSVLESIDEQFNNVFEGNTNTTAAAGSGGTGGGTDMGAAASPMCNLTSGDSALASVQFTIPVNFTERTHGAAWAMEMSDATAEPQCAALQNKTCASAVAGETRTSILDCPDVAKRCAAYEVNMGERTN